MSRQGERFPIRMGTIRPDAYNYPGMLARSVGAGHHWRETETEQRGDVMLHVFACSRCGQEQVYRVYDNGLCIETRDLASCDEAIASQVHEA